MKKILEITTEVEQHLVSLMDTALKSAGTGALGLIDKLRSFIKTVPDDSSAPVAPAAPDETASSTESAGQ